MCIRDSHGGLPDLLADLLVPGVHFHPEALGVQSLLDLLGVGLGPVGNGQDLHLHRREPGGERTGEVLGDHADEPLDGAQQRPVDHDGAMLLAVLTHILQLKPDRKSTRLNSSHLKLSRMPSSA